MNSKHTSPIINKAIEVFTSINGRINSLIDCSAKDFDILNQNFQNYYNEIKNLTDKVDEFLNTLISIPESEISKIADLIKINETEIRTFYNNTSSEIDHSLKNCEKGLSLAILHINNLKQNVSTLRLQTTNIQFEPQFRSLYIEIIQILDQLFVCFSSLDTEFHVILKRVKICEDGIEDVRTRKIPSLLNSLNKIKITLETINATKGECEDYKIILDEVKSIKTITSSEIITNLQFQDIIRQKIEHVQQAHQLLLDKLKTENIIAPEGVDDSNQISNSIQYQIRDIGALQAAQLVHANYEYQKAVENITNKFGDLDYALTETTQILYKLLLYIESNDEFSYRSFDNYISIFELEIHAFLSSNSDLFKIYEDISSINENYNSSGKKIIDWIEDADILIKKLKPIQPLNDGKQFINPVNQIFNNLEKLKNVYLDISSKNESDSTGIFTGVKLKNYSLVFNKIEEISAEVISRLKKIPEIRIEGINIENRPWKGNQNDRTNDFNFDDVKYYKVFDNEVDEIIILLNSLINQMNLNNDNVNPETDIDRLKRFYTMDSERAIHKSYIGKDELTHNSELDVELF